MPQGGLAGGALHEVVPEDGGTPAAFGFIVALLARVPRADRSSSSSRAMGFGQLRPASWAWLDARWVSIRPVSILVETAHRQETLWAMEEALRSGAPAAVAGVIDKLDLKSSQRLQLAAADAGLPLFLLRPAQTLESSAAATRWRVGPAAAARDRFGLYRAPALASLLERCRNGRAGEWMVEYDHVAHRFSLAAALADPALSRGAGETSPSDKPVDPDQPFVLAITAAGGPRIAALNEAAEAAGLAAGEPLADARAKADMLQVRAVDAAADDAALRRLALWATRYTPTASPWGEENGADGFFLDIEGAAHLFGGEEKLMADLAARLEKISACRRGLPSPIRPARPGRCRGFTPRPPLSCPRGRKPTALAPLPIEALAAFAGNLHDAAPARLQIRRHAARQAARAVCRAFSGGVAAPARSGARPRR